MGFSVPASHRVAATLGGTRSKSSGAWRENRRAAPGTIYWRSESP